MPFRALAFLAVLLANLGAVPAIAHAETPGRPPMRAAEGFEPGVDASISVDGSAEGQPISPWIYGLNSAGDPGTWGASPTQQYVTTLRLGGNRWSAYNWKTNWSNAGSDYGPYHNDQLLSTSSRPGEAVRVPLSRFYGRARAMGSAALVTVPLLGYVAGSWTGNAPIPVAPGPTTAGAPMLTGPHAFVPSLASRPGDSHHQRATATPDPGDGTVYQDDFLKWLDATFPGHKNSDREPLFISLDGEPDGWGTIHPEVRGGQHPLGPDAQGKWEYEKVELPFEDLISRSVDMARAVKDVLGPRALVFGPVMAGWTGFINLDQKRPPAGYEYFLEYYLAEMRRAGQADGRRLLDALDVHLYPEATNGGSWAIANEYAPQEASQIVVREQAPRTFWDPQYYEQSWITQYGVVPPCGYGCTPQMIPRLERMIATHDPPFSRADGQPGTHLAISEYALYRAGDISGAIAQADMLGILGREGVYEASAWANSSEWAPGYGGFPRPRL